MTKYKVTGKYHGNPVEEFVDSDSKATLYDLYSPQFGYTGISIFEANSEEIEADTASIQEAKSQTQRNVVVPTEAELMAMAAEQLADDRFNGSDMNPNGSMKPQSQRRVQAPPPKPKGPRFKHYKLGEKSLRVDLNTGILEEHVWIEADLSDFPDVGFKYARETEIEQKCKGFDLYVKVWKVLEDDSNDEKEEEE